MRFIGIKDIDELLKISEELSEQVLYKVVMPDILEDESSILGPFHLKDPDKFNLSEFVYFAPNKKTAIDWAHSAFSQFWHRFDVYIAVFKVSIRGNFEDYYKDWNTPEYEIPVRNIMDIELLGYEQLSDDEYRERMEERNRAVKMVYNKMISDEEFRAIIDGIQ